MNSEPKMCDKTISSDFIFDVVGLVSRVLENVTGLIKEPSQNLVPTHLLSLGTEKLGGKRVRFPTRQLSPIFDPASIPAEFVMAEKFPILHGSCLPSLLRQHTIT
mmetsp:Transcript_23526/g.35747  ORF Transcript_23526/g.35747 Transcript_23526/m.35747 type:complete len:105 (+) Transcript_23526:285-599(+)